ncbi:MAG TPA: MBL fold metallo-hydrolase [Syntrophales bacterium]|nr:MBL fold metallo-hydrolase [Syntrophales bacterium]HOX95098.1 MBL fold metallo-hydrolase [Syntrophales bacterium]HPI57847.1 MBL fold metallo-hydrolase [Syntrophales bacterium]HPN24505.1 MBL fold metallo-hydrolase [Syntrophales bacterium]HQM28811.1 MBL fold metallo-hydrolase [Syntrophales bacterium]
MSKPELIFDGIYLIGGPDVTLPDDAAVFIIDFRGEAVMIDAGAGRSTKNLVRNIEKCGFKPQQISHLILTHCHIDHIGSAPDFRARFGCKLVAHDLDADAMERGDPVLTAANWYGTEFPPTLLDLRLKGEHEILRFGEEELHCLHTPGHTPGSLSLYLDRGGKRILFGQDIHGPFMPSFKSDVEMWKKSMQKLLALEADILCEGHFGIFRSKEKVKEYINGYLRSYS